MTLTDRYLRRLRLRLTALFALATAAALAVLVVVVLRVDSDLRWTDMNATLLARSQRAAEAVAVEEDGAVDVSRFLADRGLTEDWPNAWIYEVTPEGEVIALAGPVDDWMGVELEDLAWDVAFEDVDWIQWVPASEAEDVHGHGVKVLDGGDVRAVALAVAPALDFFSSHRQLAGQVWVAAVLLTGVAAAGGFWLAGKGTQATGDALAQQERLLSDAAHELRTPVAQIRAVAESGLAGDEPPEEALTRVVRLGSDAGQMVDDMLVLARMDAGRERVATESLRLDLLAEQVVAEFPDVKVEAVETVVGGDPGLLRRAVSNLVRNAVIHGGSQVKVTVYPKRVVVTDRGPGIAPGIEERLFERFHSSGSGHGLGLPIVAWIADAHGGSVSVANRDGGGVEAVLDLGQ
jgi:two-component system OmpR family sensor kinase